MSDNLLPFGDRKSSHVPSARRPRPGKAQTYRLKLTLLEVTPPIWREIDVDSSVTLDELHTIVQIALGWTDSHLHQWIAAEPTFENRGEVERFVMDLPDPEEWEQVTPEAEVHLDELLQVPGDQLWYNYDFGDDWMHLLELIEVRPGPPAATRVLAAENACPPEDIGGAYLYQNLVDLDAARRGPNPPGEDEVDDWLAEVFKMQWPAGAIDQKVDIDAINQTLAMKPASVLEASQPWRRTARPEFVAFLDKIPYDPPWSQTVALVEKARAAAEPVTPQMAERATAQIRWLLDYVGEGLPLTSAKYLRPADVAAIAAAWRLDREWIGKLNRESDLIPLQYSRRALQNLGLLRAAKGAVTRTKVATKLMDDPVGLWEYLAAKVPGRAQDHEREASFAYLIAIAAEVDDPNERAAQIMAARGWRTSSGEYSARDVTRDAWAVKSLLTRLGGYESSFGIGHARATPIGVAFARSALMPETRGARDSR